MHGRVVKAPGAIFTTYQAKAADGQPQDAIIVREIAVPCSMVRLCGRCTHCERRDSSPHYGVYVSLDFPCDCWAKRLT
jgi:hypothetical protein